MEWTAQVRGGPYYVHFFYASGQRRPCRVSINRREQPAEVLGETTGGFMPQQLRWQTYGPWDFREGKNTVRIATAGHMPHLKGLVVSTGRTPPREDPFRDLEAEAEARLAGLNLEGLRAAVSYLAEEYTNGYPRAEKHLARLDVLEGKLARLRAQPQPAAL